ncbi:hypothetical protein [Anabaena azotica]|uniref:Uncharacterized protein n=1 Tax=Anabaena azotica FACHB-119 TaxID=947527 RepID=A0ABR8DDG5_9NOST|nr:hypothetical protein [Anabaena azotica]MBD2504641.1 hypothetical protein [Anabaena azotica FACHB-119]
MNNEKLENQNNQSAEIRQPVSQDWHSREEPTAKEQNLTANPGDKIDDNKSLEEKAQQVAVDSPDITGDHITVPTYFVVDYPDGEKKALHHVKDAEEISDVIRQARVDEDGNRIWW